MCHIINFELLRGCKWKKIQHENSIWFEFDLQPRNSFLEIFFIHNLYVQPIPRFHPPKPYCLVQIQNQQFDSFVFTCTQPVNSKFTIWHPFKCNDDGGFRSFLIYSYVCLSIQMSVCPSVDLSIRLPACLNPNCGQTVPCRIKINSNKGRSLDKELSGKGNVGRGDTFFPVVKYNYLCADNLWKARLYY